MIQQQQQGLRGIQPLREPGDFRGTARMTDWSAGFNVLRLQDFPFAVVSTPGFWDARNVDWYSVPGTFRLCAQTLAIAAAEASDHEYLLYAFQNALYRIPTANFDATLFQKFTSALASPPVPTALANVYPGAVAPRGAVVWRDQLIVASGDAVARVMSAAEVWTTIAPPAGVVGPVSGQAGIYQDDRLLVWWEGTAQAGLYAWEGTAWAKIYPTAGTTPTASAMTCDAIIRGAGSTLLFLRDQTGMTTLVEIAQLSTGTQFQTWLEEPGMRVWPQCGDTYQGDVWFVARLGNHNNAGAFFHKVALAAPEIIEILDTNFATAAQKGLDWSWRCARTVGDSMWIGGSSRENHDAALYRFFIDTDSGQPAFGPTSVVDTIVGPIYSIGILPPGATGATTTERLHLSVTKNIYYRDRDNDVNPLLDAPSGYIQFSDIDLGIEDHIKVWNFIDCDLLQKSAGGTVEVQYRLDPAPLDSASSPWRSAGFAISAGNKHILMPDDNPAKQLYGTRCRKLQLRIVIQRATSGAVRDTIDTVVANCGQILPLTAAAA